MVFDEFAENYFGCLCVVCCIVVTGFKERNSSEH